MADEEKRFDQLGNVKKGQYVLIEGHVCEVKGVEKSKPGKHGAAKVRLSAMDIFTGSKYGILKNTAADVEIPILLKGVGQIVAIQGDVLQVMDTTSYEMFNVRKPTDVPGLANAAEVEFVRYGENVKITRKRGGE